ncbi:lipid II:glycine glycyltransferase FemX [Treponema sp.]
MASSFKGLSPTDLARCDGASSFLQSGFWGSFKARFNWNARAFLVDWGEGGKLPLLAIRRKLGFGSSFAYIPWGPELPSDFPESEKERSAALEELAVELQHQLPPDTAFIRFDPPWASEAESPAPRLHGHFKRAGADVQPPDTVIVDLSRGEEAMLSAMKSKWRYNIRLAEKKGVVVKRDNVDGLKTFYSLYEQTAKRDRIAIHGFNYYQTLLSHGEEYRDGSQDLRIYIAEYAGEALAAIITLFRGEEATYLYGASSDSHRELMPAYALQWRAMRDAAAMGCTRYDLFGIPPYDDRSHPMAGLYRFKTGFGGKIIHRAGSWDYAYKPLVTFAFRCAEAVRKALRTAHKARRTKD